jgi:hypothetical protein
MAGQVSKANARQGKANESFYKSYQNSSRREMAKMRRMLKDVYRHKHQTVDVGANYGTIIVKRWDADEKTWKVFRSDISKAWATCSNVTGVAKAKEIANAMGLYQ